MNDHDTIRWIGDSFKYYGLAFQYQERKDGGLGIHATGIKRVKRIIETLGEYLSGTKYRAALKVYEWILSRLSRDKGEPYTREEMQMILELREINGNLNKKQTPIILRDYTSKADI